LLPTQRSIVWRKMLSRERLDHVLISGRRHLRQI
jgi:hypothetical protein